MSFLTQKMMEMHKIATKLRYYWTYYATTAILYKAYYLKFKCFNPMHYTIINRKEDYNVST